MSEELDVVKSLELTAENSYSDGYRAGIEKMRDELCEVWPEDSRFSRSIRTVINQEANKLLAQTQEDKS